MVAVEVIRPMHRGPLGNSVALIHRQFILPIRGGGSWWLSLGTNICTDLTYPLSTRENLAYRQVSN